MEHVYRCANCGEEWYTLAQAKAREERMNEWLKANIGYDWLAANRARRLKRAKP